MARQGRYFEKANAWIYELDKEKYKVRSPALVYDKAAEVDREIDVLIEYTDERKQLRRIAIECRDRKGTQNVMWIDQLIGKKISCEIDYWIATVSSDFSKAAIEKAKNMGIILEKAEFLSADMVITLDENLLADVYLVKYIISHMIIVKSNGQWEPLKKTVESLPILKKDNFLHEINFMLLEDCNPFQFLPDDEGTKDAFFESEENNIKVNGEFAIRSGISEILDDLDINAIKYSINIVPFRISLPLNKSVSVFSVPDDKNKNYRAYFGAEGNSVDIGYIGEDVCAQIDVKCPGFFGYIGMKTKLNTVLPEDSQIIKINEDYLFTNLPKCDFSRVI